MALLEAVRQQFHRKVLKDWGEDDAEKLRGKWPAPMPSWPSFSFASLNWFVAIFRPIKDKKINFILLIWIFHEFNPKYYKINSQNSQIWWAGPAICHNPHPELCHNTILLNPIQMSPNAWKWFCPFWVQIFYQYTNRLPVKIWKTFILCYSIVHN